jgi:histidine ammonia-lyase
MSIDACRGTDAFLDPRVHEVRNQPGQAHVAARLRELLKGSQIIPSHVENDPRVQDPYSLRCTPQVLGAAWDCLGYVKQAIERELGAVTDNPLVFAGTANGQPNLISAGNFHGMPLAIPLDAMTIALSHIAGISERRTFWMLAAHEPEARLRPYLSSDPGLNSGMMILQYTAAACCNEIIGLAMPASVANVPTSAGIEDYNSFGPRAAAKARRALELVQAVVGIELLCAAQGLESHRPLRSGAGVEKAHAAIRRVSPPLTDDRSLAEDMRRVADLVRLGSLA